VVLPEGGRTSTTTITTMATTVRASLTTTRLQDYAAAMRWYRKAAAQGLRVYVRQLRHKIEADPEQPQYILTETGIGYRLRAPD
jgi:DNA-binding response OmpR family regulator